MKPLRKQTAARVRIRIHVHNHNPEEKGHSLTPDCNCAKCSVADMAYTEGQSVGLSLLLGRHGACGYEWQSLRAGIGQQAIPSIGIAAQGRSPPAHSLIASNPTRCLVQGRTKQFLLSSATHVLSGLVGCALAAWVAGNRREGKF